MLFSLVGNVDVWKFVCVCNQSRKQFFNLKLFCRFKEITLVNFTT